MKKPTLNKRSTPLGLEKCSTTRSGKNSFYITTKSGIELNKVEVRIRVFVFSRGRGC